MPAAIATALRSNATATAYSGSSAPVSLTHGFQLALQAVHGTPEQPAATTALALPDVGSQPAPPAERFATVQRTDANPAAAIVLHIDMAAAVSAGGTAGRMRIELKVDAKGEPLSGDANRGATATHVIAQATDPTAANDLSTSTAAGQETSPPVAPQDRSGPALPIPVSNRTATGDAVTPKPASIWSIASKPGRLKDLVVRATKAGLASSGSGSPETTSLQPPHSVADGSHGPASSATASLPLDLTNTISANYASAGSLVSGSATSEPSTSAASGSAASSPGMTEPNTFDPAVPKLAGLGTAAPLNTTPGPAAAGDTPATPPAVPNPTPPSMFALSPRTAPPHAGDTMAAAKPDGAGPAGRKPTFQAVSAAADRQTLVAAIIDPPIVAAGSATAPPAEQQQATSATQAVGVPASSSHVSPAHQIAPALLAVTQSQDGIQRITLRLHPDDLGMVQVQIERAATGPARVEITAGRADTLQMLQQDQLQLHRTLDQAGVPALGRTITFHVAPVAEPAPAQLPGSAQSTAGNTFAHSGHGNAPGTGGGYAARDQANHAGNRRPNTGPSKAFQPDEITPVKWLRAGLDITA